MKKNPAKEMIPYMPPSTEEVCIHMETAVLNPSMDLPEIGEEDLGWGPASIDLTIGDANIVL